MNESIQADDRRLRKAMTVARLIEALQDCDPEAIVFFSVDYGDHGHTQQALPVRDVTLADDEGKVITPSAYSQSRMAVTDTDECDDDCRNNFEAVILQ